MRNAPVSNGEAETFLRRARSPVRLRGMSPNGIDQTARDMARDALASIASHEKECEQVRRRIDEFIDRLDSFSAEIRNAIQTHADEDREAFKGVYNRFWWLAGGGYGVMIPLIGFLATELFKTMVRPR